jgi:hypothetical protein
LKGHIINGNELYDEQEVAGIATGGARFMKSHILNILFLAVVILAAACSKVGTDNIRLQTTSDVAPTADTDINFDETNVTVFLSKTCSCCKDWVSYLKEHGLQIKTTYTDDIYSVKERYQITRNMVACHTAIIGNYFVEGHVPVEAIEKLLTEEPDIDGIALPGMPSGSPGMSGLQTKPMKIYGLSNGAPTEFMLIGKQE